MSLIELHVGQKGYVKEVHGDRKLKQRLKALGCVEDTQIELLETAPLGDPIVFRLRSSKFALRKRDARNIIVN
jgi:ferrous iron transport protein A